LLFSLTEILERDDNDFLKNYLKENYLLGNSSVTNLAHELNVSRKSCYKLLDIFNLKKDKDFRNKQKSEKYIKSFCEKLNLKSEKELVALLKKEYLEKNNNVKKVGEIISLSEKGTGKLLKKYNLIKDFSQRSISGRKNKEGYLSKILRNLNLTNEEDLKQFFIKKYLIENKTVKEISKELGIPLLRIMYFLKEYSITKDISLDKERTTKRRILLLLKEFKFEKYDELFNFFSGLYINQNLSVLDIATKLSLNLCRIYSILKTLNIKKDKSAVNDDRLKKIKITNSRRYGVECTLLLASVQKQSKETCLEKYGVENPWKSLKIRKQIKETNLKKYGVAYPICSDLILKKQQKNNIKKYGVKSTLLLDSVQKQIKETCLEKFGVENPLKSLKIRKQIKETCLVKYGFENPFQVEEFKEKARQTCLIKYGVEYPMQSEEIQERIHETKKRNGSYTKSKEEDDIYYLMWDMLEQLSEEDVERQHKEDIRYPFACDFHLAESDCFIEYQGHPLYHGKEPYDGKNEPKEWALKAETSDNYKNAIKTYTESDPLKRIYASSYCLNYLEMALRLRERVGLG